VVKQTILETCSAFGAIWSNFDDLEVDIMHEYGHFVQERILGAAYWPSVAIPSMLYNTFTNTDEYQYYSMPWERVADWLGGIKNNRKNVGYKKGALTWGIVENVLGAAVIPFYFMFGY